MLRRLLANAPEDLAAGVSEEEISQLSYQEAQELTSHLREAGVEPTPSEAQIDFVESLLEDL